MDDDIEEVKRLAKQNLALAQDTNRMVHRMRRSALWGRFFQFVWWTLIIIVSGATYYLYLQPYVNRIEQLYSQFGTTTQTPGINQEIQQFLQRFSPRAK